MTNDILNTETIIKDKVSSKSTKVKSPEVKSGLSLFDQILNKSTSKNENTSEGTIAQKVLTKQNTIAKTTIEADPLKSKTTNNLVNSEILKSSSEKVQEKPISLLDSMLSKIKSQKKDISPDIETKKNISTESKEKTLVKIIDSNIPSSEKEKSTKVIKDVKIVNEVETSNKNDKTVKEVESLNKNVKTVKEVQVSNKDVKRDEISQSENNLIKNDKNNTLDKLNTNNINLNISKIKTAIKDETINSNEEVKISKNIEITSTVKEKVPTNVSDVKLANSEKVLIIDQKNISSIKVRKDEAQKVIADNTLVENKKTIVNEIANEKHISKSINNTKETNFEESKTKTEVKTTDVIIVSEDDVDIETPNIIKSISSNVAEKKNDGSLLGQLIENAKTQEKNNGKINIFDNEKLKDNIKASSFLNEQLVNKKIISRVKINESKEVLLDEDLKTSSEKITKSAKVLELNPKNVIVEQSKEQNKKDILLHNKITQTNNFLDKIFLNKNENIDKAIIKNSLEVAKEVSVKNTEVKKASNEEIVVNLEATTLQNITTKIISARQNVTSFMSDLSKKMYENYKPPVTSFRINLHPATLGSISIIIKSNKAESNISVSMNMSQSSTLDVLEQNKSSLQNALQKTFNSDESFSLDFNMQDNQNNENNNFGQSDKNNKQSNSNEETINSEILNEESLNEQNQDYM